MSTRENATRRYLAESMAWDTTRSDYQIPHHQQSASCVHWKRSTHDDVLDCNLQRSQGWCEMKLADEICLKLYGSTSTKPEQGFAACCSATRHPSLPPGR